MELPTEHTRIEDIPDDLGAYVVMGNDGDTKHIWNPRKPEEVEAARTLFEALTAKGYRAFKLNWLGSRGKPAPYFSELNGRAVFVEPEVQEEDGEVLNEHDPGASRVVFTPPMQGG